MQFDSLKKEHENDLKVMVDEIETLKKTLETIEQEKLAKQQTMASLREEKEAAERACIEAYDETAELHMKLDDQNRFVEKLTSTNDQLEKEVGKLEVKIKELTTKIDKKEQQIKTLRNDIGQLKAATEAGNQDQEKLIKDLRSEINDNQKISEKRFDCLQGKIDELLQFVIDDRNTRNVNEFGVGNKIISTKHGKKTSKKTVQYI